MVSVPPQRVSYFSNTLPYGELLSLKPTWSWILALKVCWNFAISINRASSCVDFVSMNPDEEQTFSTSVQVEKFFMLTSRGVFFFLGLQGKVSAIPHDTHHTGSHISQVMV